MLKGFFHYGVIKTARKTFWKPYSGLRSFLARKDGSPPKAGRTAYGVDMIQNWHDRTFVYCHAGIYGKFLANELSNFREPFAFVDIGANQGLYSLIAANNPFCSEVVAFEPVSGTHSILEANIALSAQKSKIRTCKLGIAASPGAAQIRVPEGHSGMASLSPEQNLHAEKCRVETIETVSSDELGGLLPEEPTLFVKVDVEGLEKVVIRQLLDSEAGSRIKAIFYEVDNRWSKEDEIAAMLDRANFKEFTKVGFGHHFDVMAVRP